ncbi:MAG: hypothetical protein HUU37_02290 [Bdellovibrionales bacterium]|nr:hypothetical protein [Bdellovibrionales bacterium]
MAAAVFIYGPALSAPFFFSDDAALVFSPALQAPVDWRSLATLFTPAARPEYYPIRDLSYMLDLHVLGGDPSAFRAHSLALHFLNSWLITRILRHFGVSSLLAALFGGAWCLWPAQAETVVWISSRRDLLALFFTLLSVLSYLRYQRTGSARFGALALLCFFLGLLGKVTYGLLPGSFILWCVLTRRRTDRWAIAAAVLGVFWLAWQAQFISSVHRNSISLPLLLRWQLSLAALGRMAAGLVHAKWIALDVETAGAWWLTGKRFFTFLGGGIWIAWMGGAWYAWRRARDGLLLALFLAVAAYAIYAGVLTELKSFYAGRYIVPAFTVLFVAGAVFWARFFREKSGGAALALAAGFLLVAAQTPRQVALWSSSIGASLHAVSLYPDNIALKSQLLAGFWNAGMPEQARALAVDIEGRCASQADVDGVDPCWFFYAHAKRVSEWTNQAPAAAHFETLLIGSMERRGWHSSRLWKFKRALRTGGGVEEAFRAWDEWQERKVLPEHRVLHWLGVCFVEGEGVARAVFQDFMSRRLIDKRAVDEALSEVRRKPPAGCYESFSGREIHQ